MSGNLSNPTHPKGGVDKTFTQNPANLCVETGALGRNLEFPLTIKRPYVLYCML
jgi:hypothetical protein